MPLDSFIDPLVNRARNLIGRKSKCRPQGQVVHYSGGEGSSSGRATTADTSDFASLDTLYLN
jgi:hypothetical protein